MSSGKIIAAHELQARWAYAELDSERFGANFSGPELDRLRGEKARGKTFDQIDRADHAALVRLLYSSRDAGLIGAVSAASNYRAEEWTKVQFTRIFVVPHYGNGRFVPYAEFYFGAPRTGPDGSLDEDDARVQALRIPAAPDPQDVERLILVRRQGLLVLVEGYLRSVVFMRSPDPNLLIPVWAPVES